MKKILMNVDEKELDFLRSKLVKNDIRFANVSFLFRWVVAALNVEDAKTLAAFVKKHRLLLDVVEQLPGRKVAK